MAKLIFLINFLGPMLSYAFVFTSEHTVGLDVCLGKGYFNFFSNQVDLCSYNSIYSKGVCMTIWILYIIGSSNILDAYIIFCCLKEIRNSTEKTKTVIGRQAYINRKRWKNICIFLRGYLFNPRTYSYTPICRCLCDRISATVGGIAHICFKPWFQITADTHPGVSKDHKFCEKLKNTHYQVDHPAKIE